MPSLRSWCRGRTIASTCCRAARSVAEGDANIKDASKPIGSNVFIWQGGDKNGSTWDGVGFHADGEGAVAPNSALLERIEGSDEVMEAIKKRLKAVRCWSRPTSPRRPTRAATRTWS